MDYNILQGNSVRALIRLVTANTSAGWIPIGGITILEHDFNARTYFQVVIRHEVPGGRGRIALSSQKVDRETGDD